jgi:hypothetical protein
MERKLSLLDELQNIVGERASDALLQRCCYSEDASLEKDFQNALPAPFPPKRSPLSCASATSTASQSLPGERAQAWQEDLFPPRAA